ncbi:MAG TPA: energy transducer TonB [Bacteroidia bacterium]|nr:energy transducer TonB [Bacteroidia bacterium]HNS11902.1 energy transducer TonB [Bacteroidia bacterium]
MKNLLKTLMLLLLVSFSYSPKGFAQQGLKNELKYGVHRVHPYISISGTELRNAQTLSDLNSNFKPSWIREFISVDVHAVHNGATSKVSGDSDKLNPEQKELMRMADVGSAISVKVQYIPLNNLSTNDLKEINFSFIPDPDKEASFPGGKEKLNQYLKINAIDKIPDGTFGELTLAAVKFSIDMTGKVIDAHVFESSKNPVADELLIQTILNMPKWSPAEYENGQKAIQDFVLTVGDMENCMVNLLNIQ